MLHRSSKFWFLFTFGLLQDNFFASFFLGWGVTTTSGICAYPFDTVRRRMMLTSGESVRYHNAFHALREIIRHEGFYALFRGVSANILLGMAGAGVLAGYDKLHRIAHGHGYRFEPCQKMWNEVYRILIPVQLQNYFLYPSWLFIKGFKLHGRKIKAKSVENVSLILIEYSLLMPSTNVCSWSLYLKAFPIVSFV